MHLAKRACLGAGIAFLAGSATAAPIIFDDFNVDEGHFNLAPNFSGSSSNIAATSTADRNAAGGALEGAGFERLVLNATTAGSASRDRFLSGSGTPANNINFATSAGTDGWIGFYARTSSTGWTGQIWVEPGSTAPAATGNNGSVEKSIVSDGAWHLYEWNLDDNSGGANGWGNVTGVVTGTATVGDGNHTIDSILFRNSAAPASGTIDFDFVAKSDSGSIAALVPEPTAFGLAAFAGVALLRRRRS